MKKTLPIRLPSVTAHPYHSCILAILSAYEYTYPWICGNYIQMKGKTYFDMEKNIQKMDLQFLMFDYEYSDVIPFFRKNTQKILKNNLDAYLAISNINIIDFIIDQIEQNYYLIIHLDEYYCSFAELYQKKHVFHQVVVYGYDTIQKTFKIGGNFKHFCFKLIEIESDKFAEAYINTNKNYFIMFLKIENVNFLSYEFIFRLLKDYLMGLYSPTFFETSYLYGITIYQIFQEYLAEVIKKEQLYLDIRRFHLLWDHSRIMSNLSQYLFTIGKIDMKLVNDFKSLEQKILVIRNLVLKFNTSHDIKDLLFVNNELYQVKERETQLIEELLYQAD